MEAQKAKQNNKFVIFKTFYIGHRFANVAEY